MAAAVAFLVSLPGEGRAQMERHGPQWANTVKQSGAGEEGRLVLQSGDQKMISRPGLVEVVVSSGAADIEKAGENSFVLVGMEEGRAEILLRFENGTTESMVVEVVRPPCWLERECEQLLGRQACDKLVILQVQDRIVVRGTIEDAQTLARFRRLCANFPEVVDLTEVSPAVLDAAVAAMNAELQRAGLDGVRARRVGSKVLLEGSVSDELERKRARLIVEAYWEKAVGEGR
ncbi:MAG: hypothetical protein D6806_08245 [Deltaproteobacteria bacterium]|nr:MAG: hypothetical protein D6806_08245 [Deltaproteobacteria bacterium]